MIINRGKLVATDSVHNLTRRLHGSETVLVEVEPRSGDTLPAGTVQQKLEQVAGVSRVVRKHERDGRHAFEVESLRDGTIRPELARAVIESGWKLTELHAVGLSLEEIFLQLTASEKPAGRQGR